MKRSVLVVGILVIVMLSTADLMAQRNGRSQRGNDQRGGKEVRNKKGKSKKNNRNVRVIDRRTVSYDGYYGSSYNRYGSSGYYKTGRHRKLYRPSQRHIWIEGQWKYNRRLRRDVWYDGYWVVKQRKHQWIPAHYDRHHGVRVWVSGCWVIT